MTQPGTGPQDNEHFERDSNLSETVDDRTLVDFLRHHAPSVPEPGDLEDSLMQAIALEPIPQATAVSLRSRHRPRRLKVSIAAVLGVGAVALGVQIHRWLVPGDFSTAELAQLESYMVNDWDETLRPPEVKKSWDWFELSAISTTSKTNVLESNPAKESSVRSANPS